MLTLDEAIKHCEEKAEELREQAGFDTDNERYRMSESEKADCIECANEHEQLAEWLTELKELRETMEMIKRHYILVEKSPKDNPNDLLIGKVFVSDESELKENDK